MKDIVKLGVLMCIILITGCNDRIKNDAMAAPREIVDVQPIGMTTSDAQLQKSFDWALNQALAYAHDDNDPVGKWYEAALPERSAFCMRDVSHQANGANVIGLQAHNKNMLYKFAENISESKDWCSYWEINKWDKPAPIDYKDDKHFWYNLPANFDVLITCLKQYQWTGDDDYIEDSVFLNFYHHTMTSYIDRWELGLDKIMQRDRFVNTQQPLDEKDWFQICRGLPSYEEAGPMNFFLGSDMFAIQYQAFKSYAEIMNLRGEATRARELLAKAEAIKAFFNANWWDESANSYYSILHRDGVYMTKVSRSSVFSGISDFEGRQTKTLTDLIAHTDTNVESLSYYPQTFYDYDANEAAYDVIMEISREDKARREYPEVSYGVAEAIIKGMMGLEVNAKDRVILTMSRLSKNTEWASFTDIPVFDNAIHLKHEGFSKSTLTNVSGEKIIWRAAFPSTITTLIVNGESISASNGITRSGLEYSWVVVSVTEGKTVVVDL